MAESYDIKLFGMGGTIDKVVFSYENVDYVVDSPQAERIFTIANLSIRISIESVARKDSLQLDPNDRSLLRQRIEAEPCNRIIVTHGTDTIPQTAEVLRSVIGKTIVFTGAMLPARFIDSDATFNLGGAVIAAQTLPPGLYLVIHGKVLDPLTSVKDRARGRIE